jgi:hypothetical protein
MVVHILTRTWTTYGIGEAMSNAGAEPGTFAESRRCEPDAPAVRGARRDEMMSRSKIFAAVGLVMALGVPTVALADDTTTTTTTTRSTDNPPTGVIVEKPRVVAPAPDDCATRMKTTTNEATDTTKTKTTTRCN